MTKSRTEIENDYKAFLEQFGKNVRYFRKVKFGSQDRLIEKLEVNKCTLSHIESGLCSPRLETIFRLAMAFEITPDQLLRNIDRNNSREILNAVMVSGFEQLNEYQQDTVKVMAEMLVQRMLMENIIEKDNKKP